MMKIYFLTLLTLISLAAPAQQQLIYQTKNLPKPDTTWVFTPKSYKKLDKLPTIFLLHGYSGNYKQWHNIMDAQKYADDYGFIIVCPDGMFNSWYFNSPTKPNWQFESFFFEELFTDIKQKFKVDEKNIFISGLSMGGHGALSLFLKQPNLFKSAGSSSGVVDLRSSTVKYGIADLLGKPTDDSDIWLKYSVIGNLEKLKGSTKQIIFDCGSEDPFYKINNNLKKLCDELKINATYIAQPGKHNKAYWAKAIAQQFQFFKTQLTYEN